MTLDLSGLSGVTLYEPAELMLSAKAGTPLCEAEALLDKNNQQLDFEPMDYGPLLGAESGPGMLDGAIATNCPARAASRPAPRAITSSAARR